MRFFKRVIFAFLAVFPALCLTLNENSVVSAGIQPTKQTELFPPIEPFHSGYLSTGDGHEIYYEESGNPEGKPILFIHGGPGYHSSSKNRRFFDPKSFRIILMDQRGCGKSKYNDVLTNNTTQKLIQDIELLRNFLSIKQWYIFGGSWGSTLSLLYAEAYPELVSGMVLYSTVLYTSVEIHKFYSEKSKELKSHWNKFQTVIPKDERSDIVKSYCQRMRSSDAKVRKAAVNAWVKYESAFLNPSVPSKVNDLSDGEIESQTIPSMIECHYVENSAFIKENQIMKNIAKIKAIPTVIVHGTLDHLASIENSRKIHSALPKSQLIEVPGAGHRSSYPTMQMSLLEAVKWVLELNQ